MDETWAEKLSFLSKITPKTLTDSADSMVPPMSSSEEQNQSILDFPKFRIMSLVSHQFLNSEMTVFTVVLSRSRFLAAIFNPRSSAKKYAESLASHSVSFDQKTVAFQEVGTFGW